ncbi:MAG: hypothetical protein HC906_03475 [Bacteroidales bacterium]|nr:hypothetical protein [Bacteroidales bacterium]
MTLIDMPREHDWILYAPYSDKTLMRNILSFDLGRQLGNYQCRGRFVELYINDDYRGVYVLLERIKRDPNRVNVIPMDPSDTSGVDLTGGYIVKIDRFNTLKEGWYSPYTLIPRIKLGMGYVFPKPEDITIQQKNYIKSRFAEFEENLLSEEFDDPLTGYTNYIDVNSFIDLMIMNELIHNIDSYRLSTFFIRIVIYLEEKFCRTIVGL